MSSGSAPPYPQDLALQWDVCIGMVQWDGRWPVAPPPPAGGRDTVVPGAGRRSAP
jgi:hypothetical protein